MKKKFRNNGRELSKLSRTDRILAKAILRTMKPVKSKYATAESLFPLIKEWR